jgi:hypothetical protein
MALAKPSWFGNDKLQPSNAALLYGLSGMLAAGGFAFRFAVETPTERPAQALPFGSRFEGPSWDRPHAFRWCMVGLSGQSSRLR